MHDKILRQMRKAAKAGRMVIRKHTLNEMIYGDALDGREIGLVAKIDRYGNVAIITAYWLKLSDYE